MSKQIIMDYEEYEIFEKQLKELHDLSPFWKETNEGYERKTYKEVIDDYRKCFEITIDKINILLGNEQVKDNLMMKSELEYIKSILRGEDDVSK